MRISTAQFQQQGVDSMLRQQAQVARTQQQLASGQRLQQAKDDPAASARAIGLEQASAQFGRYQAQIDSARMRLGLEENALASGTTVLQRARELAIQLNQPAQTAATRGVIAAELRQLRDEMLALANADDGQGRYLFGGSADGAPPFALAGGAARYAGDQQRRVFDISHLRSVADGDPGSEVFLRLRDGNGHFSVAAAASNQGTAQLTQSRLADASAWQGDPLTLRFEAGAYTATDAQGAIVASGAWQAGDAVNVQGLSLSFDGVPADGDRFELAPSRPLDVFAQLERLAQWAERPADSAAARAQRQTELQQGLQALSQAEAHFSGLRAGVGQRLAALDDAEAYNAAQREQAQAGLATLRDLDYAEAATRLSRQLTALQAAQQTIAQVQGLSLFDYLR